MQLPNALWNIELSGQAPTANLSSLSACFRFLEPPSLIKACMRHHICTMRRNLPPMTSLAAGLFWSDMTLRLFAVAERTNHGSCRMLLRFPPSHFDLVALAMSLGRPVENPVLLEPLLESHFAARFRHGDLQRCLSGFLSHCITRLLLTLCSPKLLRAPRFLRSFGRRK